MDCSSIFENVPMRLQSLSHSAFFNPLDLLPSVAFRNTVFKTVIPLFRRSDYIKSLNCLLAKDCQVFTRSVDTLSLSSCRQGNLPTTDKSKLGHVLIIKKS